MPEQARWVLKHTRADALMIGRRPGQSLDISRDRAFPGHRPAPALPTDAELRDCVLGQLTALSDFYGPDRGVRMARKHIQWFLRGRPGFDRLWNAINQIECAEQQWSMLGQWLSEAALPSAAEPARWRVKKAKALISASDEHQPAAHTRSSDLQLQLMKKATQQWTAYLKLRRGHTKFGKRKNGGLGHSDDI